MFLMAKSKLASYDHFVDDCLMIWTHSKSGLDKFIKLSTAVSNI